MKVKLVVATKESEETFFTNTGLGRSLFQLRTPIDLNVSYNNTEGLSKIYNQAIKNSTNEPSVLVFVHDDVTITDYYWVHRILEGLQHFDIVGVAGNKRINKFSPGWSFKDVEFTYEDNEYLSGAWGHGHKYPADAIFDVGPPRQEVKLLDGLLLASYSETLIKNNVYFDEQFDFHYYDLDFCRTAVKNNLRLGTTDLYVIHGKEDTSLGYNDPKCVQTYQEYIKKWGD